MLYVYYLLLIMIRYIDCKFYYKVLMNHLTITYIESKLMKYIPVIMI